MGMVISVSHPVKFLLMMMMVVMMMMYIVLSTLMLSSTPIYNYNYHYDQ